MYYNIKIKSNGSEFILESADKEVTQREMDLYFAGIFDVSEEFKSNIKKIEIINKSVKSIDEINETPFIQNKIEYQQTPIQEERETVKFQNEVEEKKLDALEAFYSTSFEDVEQKASDTQMEAREIENNSSIKENTIQYSEIIEEKKSQELVFEPEVTSEIEQNIIKKDELEEALKLENNESVDKKIGTYFKDVPSSIIPDVLLDSNDSDLIKFDSKKSEIDELINLAQEKIDTVDTTIDVSSILASRNKNEPEGNFSKKFKENMENSKQITDILPDEPKNDYNQVMLDDIFNTPKEEVKIEKKATPQNIPPLDFKPFLSSYKCESLQDEFMVCAYFIKHALKQPSFTIKFINSKLFQSSGKIADMSIIDEMVMKEYIKVVDYDTPKTYCITAQGEIYFASLQG